MEYFKTIRVYIYIHLFLKFINIITKFKYIFINIAYLYILNIFFKIMIYLLCQYKDNFPQWKKK